MYITKFKKRILKNIIYMKKKLYLIALTVFTVVCFNSCGGDKDDLPQFPPTPVTAYTVETAKASYYIEYPGTVVALNEVELRAEVSGYLTDIYFRDGEHVTKGAKLYAIDQQQYKAAYDVAKANYDKAKQDYERYEELAKQDAIATQILEHSEADLKAAESNLTAVETNLRNSIIYAPFDGTIGISQVKLGSAVTAGQTLMNTISSDNPMAVDFAVEETRIKSFSRLLNKKSNPGDSTFTLVLPDQTNYPYPGKLILLDRAVDTETGTITARLEFSNKDSMLKPGLTCTVRVLNNDTSKSIIIPYKAVVVQMNEYFVFVINGKKVSQRRIGIGRPLKDNIIVNSGLKPGEQIVVDGVQKLRDNSPVIVTAAGQKSPS
jgi:membrane fusion protein (multidrug efflux system)